jgi:ABC-type transport system involved in multi-copper enzyme maturation permease subunit
MTADAASLLWFSSRVTLGIQAPVLIAIAIGVFVYCALGQKVSDPPSIFRLLLSVETVLFVLLSMGLLPREKEGKTLELLLVCARSRHGLLLLKFAPVCLFMAGLALGLTTAFYWLAGGFPWFKMLWVPYVLAATVGILTVVLTTYLRNQFAAGAVALVVAVVLAVLWLDPMRTFYDLGTERIIMQTRPNLTMNRVLLAAAFGFLYDHAVRRLKHVELWMK